MSREIELKLQVAPDELARLHALDGMLAAGESMGPPVRRTLVSTYFDTPDRRLRDAGIALRVRRSGDDVVQTVKAAGRAGAGLSDYAECNTPLDVGADGPDLSGIADATLRKAVIGACDGAVLEPVFTTEFERTARLVADETGGAIEIALDEGAVIAGGSRLPLSEIELELKAGEPSRLFDLARRVVAGTAAWISTDTKAARGFRLVERRAVGPIKAPLSNVAPDATVEQAFQAIVRGCLAHLVANAPAVAERRNPEGVHQMRIALRRFRSAIKLFGDPVRSDAGAGVADRARVLARLLGAARDFDVFEAEIYAPVAEVFADDPAFPALIESIRQRREAAYDAVLGHLVSPAYTAFLLDAGEWVEARLWRRPDDPDQADALDRPAEDFAHGVLARLYRTLRKTGKRLDRLTPEARHDLRKRLKRFRYALEFLAPVFPDARLMIGRSARLQDALGVLNDGEITRTLLAQTGSRAQPGVHDWAAGAIAGWHAHAAAGHLAKTTKLWKRFRKDDALWRT